jgi:hypothetical protein
MAIILTQKNKEKRQTKMFCEICKNPWMGICLISIEKNDTQEQEPKKVKDGNTEH